MVALRLSHLQEVAIGSAKGIGGVEELAHLFLIDMKHPAEHIGNLLLAGITVARNRHLNLRRRILRNWHLTLDGSSNGYALSTSQLQHTLDVLAKERCLDSHTVWQIALDDAANTFVDMAELQVGVGKLAKVDYAQSKHFCLLPVHTKHAITHNVRARVYAKNDLLHFSFTCLSDLQKYKINVKKEQIL